MGVSQDQPALAEIVERERQKYEREPGQADGGPPEMAHVRVQRLRTRYAKHDGAHRHERYPTLMDDERRGIGRRQPLEDRRPSRDQAQAGERERGEPHQHHRTE
jgi:hypothetical protein